MRSSVSSFAAFARGFGLLDDRCGLDDLFDDDLGFEERIGAVATGLGDGFLGLSDRAHRAHAGFRERAGLDLVLDFGLFAAGVHEVAGRADDVGDLDFHRDRAGAVTFVFDGGRGGGFEDVGESGDDLVAFEAEVLHGALPFDDDTHHASGEAAVGVEFGGAFGHDFLVSLGAGESGVAHDVNDLVVDFAGQVRGVRYGLHAAVLQDFAFCGAFEGFRDLLDLDCPDDLHLTIGEELGFAHVDGADERGADGVANLVVFQSQVGDGGIGIDLHAVDALDEEAVAVEFGGADGFEAFAGACLFPDRWN